MKKFGRSTEHRKMLMRSLVTNLINAESIKTTLPKAKEARKDADKIVTLAKTSLMAFTAQMKEAAAKDADAKAAYDVLQGAKVEAKGKVITLSASTAADPALKAIADKAKELK